MSKKRIAQNDLRKVMYEHKKKLTSTKRIDSPLAKYTESGQLMCILCQSIVRNESAWPVHIVSSKHKENIELTKKTKLESVPVIKRAAPPIIQESPKKPKLQDQISFKEVKGIPADFFDKPSDTKIIEKNEDVEMENPTEVTNEIKETKKEKDSSLPEGFFDDPILDAKVRNVEYKNPMDEEWEKFQREIMEETAQSAQIIAEDQEEATAERQLEEIDVQIHHWSRVMNFVKLKESMHCKGKDGDTSMDDASSNDELEFNEEMDWRAKKSVK